MSNQLELTGTLRDVFTAQSFNKGFRKREFVIETNDKYPQKIVFQLVQDKCDMIESFGIGDTIRVAFEVKGREWQGKYFNSLEAWRIFREKAAAPEVTDVFEDPDLFPGKAPVARPIEDDEEEVAAGTIEDDLPF